MEKSDWQWAIGLSVMFFLLGLMFVKFVPPGLPYDEPSHFNIVQIHSRLSGLPVVNQNGATYEACQPPLYYILAGLVYRFTSVRASPRAAFYACRIATLAAATPLVFIRGTAIGANPIKVSTAVNISNVPGSSPPSTSPP